MRNAEKGAKIQRRRFVSCVSRVAPLICTCLASGTDNASEYEQARAAVAMRNKEMLATLQVGSIVQTLSAEFTSPSLRQTMCVQVLIHRLLTYLAYITAPPSQSNHQLSGRGEVLSLLSFFLLTLPLSEAPPLPQRESSRLRGIPVTSQTTHDMRAEPEVCALHSCSCVTCSRVSLHRLRRLVLWMLHNTLLREVLYHTHTQMVITRV